eukprot:scaffold14908_cov54-Isochrysis_galbana.AAC.2
MKTPRSSFGTPPSILGPVRLWEAARLEPSKQRGGCRRRVVVSKPEHLRAEGGRESGRWRGREGMVRGGSVYGYGA